MHVCTGTTNANRVFAGRCGKCNGRCSRRLRIHTLQSSVTLCAIGSAGPRVPLCSPREHAGTLRLAAGWLAGLLQHVMLCTRKQRTQWRRIPQAAADCFGCRWFQMFQTQLDDALRVHQRELNVARDNYSHEIKERRRSAQLSPSNRRATHACAHSGARAHRRQRTCRVRSYADASNRCSNGRVRCRLHNIVLELRGNIRVFARARPSFEGEKNHLAFPQARSRSSHPRTDPSISNRREPANTRACPCVCVYRRWQHSSGDA
jgi:hypothetical protein